MKILIIIPAKTMHILTCKEKKISKAHHHQKDNSLRPPPPSNLKKKFGISPLSDHFYWYSYCC